MRVPRSIFRQYDIRGIVGEELTPAFARALGRAFAAFARERIGKEATLAVGRDNRPSGAALAAALRAGMAAGGAAVVDVGELPTPALYFGVQALRLDGGVQVTGSHNPPEFNGFKMVLDGHSVHGDDIQLLYEAVTLEQAPERPGRESADGSVLDGYREAIVARHTLARPVRVVVDCGNGVGSVIAVPTLRALGAEVVPLFCESDGTFPNHHPDPTVPANLVDLQAEVRRTGAELGIAFDGDADRIGAVDEDGRVLFGDQLLVVLGRDAVTRFGAGTRVIFDVKCSDLLPAALRAAGAEPEMWKTGHSHIKARMKERGAALAGEMSGHMFFAGDWFGFDDALFAAARLLEIVSRGPGGLAPLLADLPPTFATPEIRVDCADDRKFEIVAAATEHFRARYPVNDIDGVRMSFANGWGLVRASNTQPILVLRFEATDEASLAGYQQEVLDWLSARGVQATG